MRTLLAVSATALLFTLAWANTGAAEDPALDLGDTNLLVIACQGMVEVGEAQDILVKNCRRNAADDVNGTRATIHVKLATNVGPIVLDVKLRKSLWSITTAVQK